MKKSFLILSIIALSVFVNPVFAISDNGINSIEKQIQYLMNEHQKYLVSLFEDKETQLTAFDKAFFTDFAFMNDSQVDSFFKNISETGNLRGEGTVSISYTSMTNINGKVTGVSYTYDCDGKNVTLVKTGYDNGKLLKAVYNYDINGKLLKAEEAKDSKRINSKEHIFQI